MEFDHFARSVAGWGLELKRAFFVLFGLKPLSEVSGVQEVIPGVDHAVLSVHHVNVWGLTGVEGCLELWVKLFIHISYLEITQFLNLSSDVVKVLSKHE